VDLTHYEGDGKDMKRTMLFNQSEDKFIVMEDDKVILVIKKDDLKFDAKKYYESFFDNDEGTFDIDLILAEGYTPDRVGKHVYNTILNLTNEICDKLKSDSFKSENEIKNES